MYLLPQISFEWKWFALAKAHYSNIVREYLTPKNLPSVSRVDNPSNVLQARPMETVVERKIYEKNWEAKHIDHFG